MRKNSIAVWMMVLGAPAARAQGQSGGIAPAQISAPQRSAEIVWDARHAEHLCNRAGFGARPEEIDAAVKMGLDAFVDELFRVDDSAPPFYVERFEPMQKRRLMELPPEERKEKEREYRESDRKQLVDYSSWWFDRMSESSSPLLERMVLFWHGFFTTAAENGNASYEVIKQNQLVRDNALGSYAKLLRGMARDAAMLHYLDNQVNRKGSPNENFARELMELFSLGEGNYTERDVKEAARALTGRAEKNGAYFFEKKTHDDGEKTVLGVTGRLDGDALVDILLKQEACARHVAKRLITHMEGVEPEPARLERYAKLLRSNDYEMQPLLRALFHDPDFYRDEVVGTRVQGPIEYLVGIARRLKIRVPATMLGTGAAMLGQRIFYPPSVKGWDEGESWITTATLMQRGNLAGLMLGVVKVEDMFAQSDLDKLTSDPMSMTGGARPASDSPAGAPPTTPMGGATPKPDEKPKLGAAGLKAGAAGYRALKKVELSGWSAALHFTGRMQAVGARTDAQIVDRMCEDLLAIRVPDDTRQKLREHLTQERALLGARDGALLDAGDPCEHLLRRLAHLILSLPEAQLS